MDYLRNYDTSLLFIVGVIVIALYFLPWVIAAKRNHNNQIAIFVLNIFGGFTYIGWVIALTWSFTDNTSKPMNEPKIQNPPSREK